MDVGCFGWGVFGLEKIVMMEIDTYDVGLCNPLLFVTINPLFIFIVMLKIIVPQQQGMNISFPSVYRLLN